MLLIEDVPNDELALMQRLGMPPDSSWVWLTCPEPVTPTALNVTLRLRDRTGQVEQVRPSSALADWYGLSFEVFGRSIFEAQRTKGHPLWRLGGKAVIEAWHARAFNVAEGIEAVAIWKPPAPARLVISAAGRRWSAEATEKARAAVHALQEFERAAGGRKRTSWQTKVDKLADDALRWMDSKHRAGYPVTVEDCGRPELGEATRRGTKGVNDHMNRNPKVLNDDVHRRMYELIETRRDSE